MEVYGDRESGNCYKIRLICALLNIEHEWIHVDILAGESGAKKFLALNPNGKIPLLRLADGRCISESNAILNYLAFKSDLLPDDQFDLAKVQQWQFFEQYSHEPYIAVARFIAKYLGLPDERRGDYESKQEGGHKALSVMEAQLSETEYLVGSRLSTADISLYGYTHVADEGGFDLSLYPAVHSWLDRIRNHPRYIGMED
ncbi:MAG: glutathione S-transferase family protein [Halioglobus sp.]